jgi:tetratricopeptide (TPR) repeat protein
VEEGDEAAAENAFARADWRGDARASCNLGVLLENRGDLAGASLAYQRADERGEPTGAYYLGLLLEREGDHEGALRALDRAAQSGSEEIADLAHSALRELRDDGDEA